MKVLNRKGIANQTGPESCVVPREVRDEALTGENLEEESEDEGSLTCFPNAKPTTPDSQIADIFIEQFALAWT